MKPDPAGATSPVISLREYLEAKIEGERELNRTFRVSTAAEFHVFKDSLGKEITEARQDVKDKMEVLNELRKAVETDRALFVRLEKFDADMKGRDAKIDAIAAAAFTKTDGVERLLATRLDGLEKWQAKSGDPAERFDAAEKRVKAMEDWRNKLLGIGVMIALFAGLVGALLMRLLAGVFGK